MLDIGAAHSSMDALQIFEESQIQEPRCREWWSQAHDGPKRPRQSWRIEELPDVRPP